MIMNAHILLDKMTVSAAAAAARDFRFFQDSLESADLMTHIQQVSMRIPELRGVGKYELTADTLAGTLDPAFWVAQWFGAGFPTIIYHHGNNERPFDCGLASKNSFKNIFLSSKKPIQANLIALRAPFHTDLRIYMKEVRRLDQFAAMLAVSVCLTEALVQMVRAKTLSPVMVNGISLGGWVANLHKAYFNSADRYIPMLAGAALDEVFTSSLYQKLAGKNVHENPERVRQVLNFEKAYRDVDLENVYPLLGRFDSIIEYDRQKSCYGDRPVQVFEKGHTTSAVAFADLRKHILQRMY
jgi:hypothetical protein